VTHPDPQTNTLHLPRPLVNQLLHAAQLHPGRAHWGVISRGDAPPDRCDALGQTPQDVSSALTDLVARIAKAGRQAWALYYCDPAAPSAPDVQPLPQFGIPLLLTVSLGTKGVLQLRAWRMTAAPPQELEVGIREA